MGKPLYHEEIGSDVARMILGDEFVHGSDMRYFIISELSQTTVLQHNDATGEEIETRLEEPDSGVLSEVPKIEKYKSEYKEQKPLGTRIQVAIIAAVGIMLIACVIFMVVVGG